MWTPKQLLDPPVAKILYNHLASEYVEFLGWISGRAQALNKNWDKHQNPTSVIKAANTMLRSEKTPKLWQAFLAKKLASQQPVTEDVKHENLDSMLRDYREGIPDDGFYRDEEGRGSWGEDFPESEPEQNQLDLE